MRAPLGIALAVPVLVKAADRFCGGITQAELAHDLRATATTQRDHLAVVAMLRQRDLRDAPHPAVHALAWQHRFPEQAE